MRVWDNKRITYGKLTGVRWTSIKGMDDEIFQQFIYFLNNIEWNDEYSVYVVGGVIEGWETWDIDMALVGPYRPPVIHKYFDIINTLCFTLGVYPDLKYFPSEDDMFKFEDWIDGNQEMETLKVFEWSDYFACNGERRKLVGEWVDGLFVREVNAPFARQLEKYYNEGRVCKNPIKIR